MAVAEDEPTGSGRRTLRDRLTGRDHSVGLLVKMPACREIEMAGAAGFAYVIVDLEHGPRDTSMLEHHMRAAELSGLPALVRVPVLDPAWILAALDCGATGVVVPHIAGVDEASAAVSAAHYPPVGTRGAAGSTRAGRYGALSFVEQASRAEQETCVVVQIEDEVALARVEEIAATSGLAGVFVGTLDLSVTAGWWRLGTGGRAAVSAAVERVARAAERHGVAALAPAGSTAEAEDWRRQGISSVVMVETSLVSAAYREAAAHVSDRPSLDPAQSIVLIPGMLCTDDLWREVCVSLPEETQTIVGRIDLDDSIAEMAASVLSVAPRRFALVGHSLGALVALEIVRFAPQRVTGLVLLNANARPPSPEQLSGWEAMATAARAGDFAAAVKDYPDDVLSAAACRDGELRNLVQQMAWAIGRDGLLRQLAAQTGRRDLRDQLTDVSVPTAIISAAEDRVAPTQLQSELAAAIPSATLHSIEDCGHMSPIERPEAVASVLNALLRTPGGRRDAHPAAVAPTSIGGLGGC